HIGLMMKSEQVAKNHNCPRESHSVIRRMTHGFYEKHAHACERKHCEKNGMAGAAVWKPCRYSQHTVDYKRQHQKCRELPGRNADFICLKRPASRPSTVCSPSQ